MNASPRLEPRGASRLKKVLLSLLVVGLLGTMAAHRTYALLSSNSANVANSSSTGTLTFEDTVNQAVATTCKTVAGTGNVQGTCDLLFTAATLRYPGDIAYAKVQIKNTGSLDGADLELSMPTCQTSQTTGSGSYFTPNVDLCKAACDTTKLTSDPLYKCTYNSVETGGTQMYIQETASNYTTAVKCLYPGPDNPDPVTPTVANAAVDCTTTDATHSPWIVNSGGLLNRRACWDLGSGPLGNSTANNSAGTNSRYFVIAVRFPANADNRMQGNTWNFKLAWHLVAGNYPPVCTQP